MRKNSQLQHFANASSLQTRSALCPNENPYVPPTGIAKPNALLYPTLNVTSHSHLSL